MKLYFKTSLSDWGFNLHERKWSLWVLWKFSLGWVVFWSIGTGAFYVISGHSISVFNYPLTARNIFGNLSFMLLMPGISEEALFRGFAIIVLSQSWKGQVTIGKLSVSVAGLSLPCSLCMRILGTPFIHSMSTFSIQTNSSSRSRWEFITL